MRVVIGCPTGMRDERFGRLLSRAARLWGRTCDVPAVTGFGWFSGLCYPTPTMNSLLNLEVNESTPRPVDSCLWLGASA